MPMLCIVILCVGAGIDAPLWVGMLHWMLLWKQSVQLSRKVMFS